MIGDGLETKNSTEILESTKKITATSFHMLAAPNFVAAPRLPTRLRHSQQQRHHPAPLRSSAKENMSIQEYIEEHALGKKVEDVINAAVKAKAPEPISFMVRPVPASFVLR